MGKENNDSKEPLSYRIMAACYILSVGNFIIGIALLVLFIIKGGDPFNVDPGRALLALASWHSDAVEAPVNLTTPLFLLAVSGVAYIVARKSGKFYNNNHKNK